MDWKLWKPGGGHIYFKYTTITITYIYISFNYDTFQNFKYYDFFITTILYILSPLYYIVIKKSYFNFLGGGARPVRPPLNPPLTVHGKYISFQPAGPWMGYPFTDLGAEGCRRSLNALFYNVPVIVSSWVITIDRRMSVQKVKVRDQRSRSRGHDPI